jgi:polyhydroxyalkanoate synthase
MAERWALDEVPVPGKLVRQLIKWLYREDRFCRGVLDLGGKHIGPSTLTAPTLAVVNLADELAPKSSIKQFIESIPGRNMGIIEYEGEIGVCLQHLGLLIGRHAHARVWPQIIAWLKENAETG